MKKILISLVLFFLILVSGCKNYYLDIEPNTKWETYDNMISITITNDQEATGVLVLDDEIINIHCIFGPGKTEFVFFQKEDDNLDVLDGDSYLFRGEYYHDKNEKTITLLISEDSIGVNSDKIILYKR